MMIVIDAIGSYIPTGRIHAVARKEEFDITDEFISKKLGIHSVSIKLESQETSDLCVNAYEMLQGKEGKNINEVDCIVVCTQNPDGNGIPHTSAIVHEKLNLSERCACFDISLGCSGYVYSLSVISSFMEANSLRRGLLFTCDPYSKIVDPADRNTALLFGDGATVTALSADLNNNIKLRPTRFSFGTRGKDGFALHNIDRQLFMDGRKIFNFSAVEVPKQVKALLDNSSLTKDDIDLFLFHQGSKAIIDQLRARMKLPVEKVPSNLADQGNTVSSSLPLLLEGYVNDRSLKRIVLSGFGVGLSWGSCILERTQYKGVGLE
jgi:3-oxoacyl-[acyl-carrier-protein] synthase III